MENVLDVQIPKKINLPEVDKMRCVQMFDPQFNMVNKIAGFRLMENAETANEIQTDQYGSRKQHKAICALLNKIIINDIIRQSRRVCY